ncbi:phosphonopyruvate decarboxylase [Planktomarina temperata]|nr:phosphonopyruvate decarboxylase [Planktomarina temperata]MDC1467560.1 phosphonopyruvate decarboxylase [Planktomarina temperata]
MLCPTDYLRVLGDSGVTFFTGVPDSLLKEFCACVTVTLKPEDHLISANEGAAVGLAIGHYIGTGSLPLVYLQNSGLGNVVNPLLSLASPEVYGTPMLLMLGWRGEPGKKDEPQHVHQGRVMAKMLEDMDLPFVVLSEDMVEAEVQTKAAAQQARDINGPVALVVKKNTFDKYAAPEVEADLPLGREEAIIAAAETLEDNAAVICTTGMPSRELFEFRARNEAGHDRDFLTVGGMGHASQIALGLAMSQPARPIYCFDGDGAVLMHMGSMAITGQSNAKNLIHLVFNNGVHGSVGGQPTVGFNIDMPKIAIACGYASAQRVTNKKGLHSAITMARATDGVSFIEVQVRPGNRADIGRPTSTPEQNKVAMMKFLGVE